MDVRPTIPVVKVCPKTAGRTLVTGGVLTTCAINGAPMTIMAASEMPKKD